MNDSLPLHLALLSVVYVRQTYGGSRPSISDFPVCSPPLLPLQLPPIRVFAQLLTAEEQRVRFNRSLRLRELRRELFSGRSSTDKQRFVYVRLQ